MVIKADEIKEGDSGVITHWVNQPDYVGNNISLEEGILTMTDKNGFESTHVDMRFPHYNKIELDENK